MHRGKTVCFCFSSVTVQNWENFVSQPLELFSSPNSSPKASKRNAKTVFALMYRLLRWGWSIVLTQMSAQSWSVGRSRKSAKGAPKCNGGRRVSPSWASVSGWSLRKKVSAALVCEESWRAFAQSLIAVFANKTTAIREHASKRRNYSRVGFLFFLQ